MDTPEFSPAFLSRYRIVGILGEGGMGRVYEGVQLALDRRVAIKVLKETDAAEIARFEREGRVLSGLKHPQILQLFEAGSEGGVPYLVSELVEGTTLRDRMSRPMSLDEVLEIGTGVARALAFAHEKDIIHRDVKPENVFVVHGTSVKLGDFGLARSAAHGATVTSAGLVMGSPPYMSPEQLSGESPSGTIDQYALGVMLYEMLAGRYPFVAPDPTQSLLMRLKEDPTPLSDLCPDLPKTVTRTVMQLIARNRKDRFESMSAVVAALEQLAPPSGTPAAIPPAGAGAGTSQTRIPVPPRPRASGRLDTRAQPSGRLDTRTPDPGDAAASTARHVPPPSGIPEPRETPHPGPRTAAVAFLLALIAVAAWWGTTSQPALPSRIEASVVSAGSELRLKIALDHPDETFLTWREHGRHVTRPLGKASTYEVPFDAILSEAEELTIEAAGHAPVRLGSLGDDQIDELLASFGKAKVMEIDKRTGIPDDLPHLVRTRATLVRSWLRVTSEGRKRSDLLRMIYHLEALDDGFQEEEMLRRPPRISRPLGASSLLPETWREKYCGPGQINILYQEHGRVIAPTTPVDLIMDNGKVATSTSLARDPRLNQIYMSIGIAVVNPDYMKDGKIHRPDGPIQQTLEFSLDASVLEDVVEARFGWEGVEPGWSVVIFEINERLEVRFSHPFVGLDIDKYDQKKHDLDHLPAHARSRGIPADCFKEGKNKIVIRIEQCPVRRLTRLVYVDNLVITLYKDPVRAGVPQ